ncbi:hypothetical protein A3K63_05480 [Candidatus Micrarchaeota archaeon RBG_16_49_10]|nr:MAG: hypothetical protein A3K63_05480 [Candidatus Micrarchaeota archaeon RBG_16_49_10]
MAKGKRTFGEWAFVIGVLLALLGGLIVSLGLLAGGTLAVLLVVLGILVGFLNVSGKETAQFLLASIALLAAGSAGLGGLPLIGIYLGSVLLYIATFVAPAAVVVALKAIFDLAKN